MSGIPAWALLRENRGDFIKQPQCGDVRMVAGGRGDWSGWVELLPEPVDETAIRMTAKVINEVAADILCVVEAENRPALVPRAPSQPEAARSATGEVATLREIVTSTQTTARVLPHHEASRAEIRRELARTNAATSAATPPQTCPTPETAAWK